MRSRAVQDSLNKITTLLDEVVEDNTAIVAELRRIDSRFVNGQRTVGDDIELAVAGLRSDIAGMLAFQALRDLCNELIAPLSAMEAMLERADFTDPEITAGHVRSLAVTLRGVLTRMGAEKVPVVIGSDLYDPARHRCVAVVDPADSPFPDAAPRTIVRLVEDGYVLNQRPLSPVRVEIQAARPDSVHQQ